MKNLKLLIILLFSSYMSFAQAPEKINYQGVARNTAGQALASQSITLQLRVRDNTATGTIIYSENHSATTNSFGLYNVAIGDGTINSGTMAGINWSAGDKFIQVRIDPAGGTTFTDLGTTQLLSVPYSLHAKGTDAVSGTTNRVAKFTSANEIGNSLIEDNGTQVTIDQAVNNNTVLRIRNSGTIGLNRIGLLSVLGTASLTPSTNPAAIYANGGTIGHGVKAYASGSDAAIWAFQNNSSASAILGRGANGANGVEGDVIDNGNAGYFNGRANGRGIRSLTSNPNAGSAGYFTSNASSLIDSGIVRVEYTGSSSSDQISLLSRSVTGTNDIYGIGLKGEGGYMGIRGEATSQGTFESYGLHGTATTNGSAYGVYGRAQKTSGANNGIKYGVYGAASGGTTNYAGYFSGNLNVTGNLSKGGGTFKIDHPKDPKNKYLYHSFVESPDMMNIYNGNATTNANGEAVVTMPDYFDALNVDFRYQLTPIGQFAQAIVWTEINGNTFSIKTDKPNVKVSWQVTGIRNDKWAQAHRVVPVVEKETENRGLYLHAQEYDLPKEKSIDWNTHEKPMLDRENSIK